ncbi:MAG: sterol desaturase family protein [Armatimonadetes bacterium]|nr:sterol desaturase family protein [Armatimonadota bacterium]
MWSQFAAFAVYFLYFSFFEWAFHRYMFHTPRFSRYMFKEHTLTHHQIYKGDETYHTHDDHPHKVPMDWWAMPAMILAHLPLFFLVQWATGLPSIWGGVAAVAAYFSIYESIHWAMHVPRAATFLNRFRVFRFLDTHHRVHHKYMLSNLNVVLPLADLCLGTLRDAEGKRVQLFGGVKAAKAKVAKGNAKMPVVPISIIGE